MLPKPCHQRLALTLASLLTAALGAAAQSETNPVFIARAEQAFQAAQTAWQADTNAPGPAIQFASTCFDEASMAPDDTRRAAVAKLGIAACRQLVARDPKSVAGHYYLAMNLGELAQAEAPSLAAYRLVHEVEREFKAAAELDPAFDFAGPVRNLGELYFQAPGWPLSVGSKHKAREWLERAAALAPDYPENQLNLLEARLKWRQREEAAATLKTLATLWPAAQKQFTGPAREKDWVDWTARRAALQAEFDRIYPAENGR